MPATRSGARTRTQTAAKPIVYVLIDKTVRNRATDEPEVKPKGKPIKKNPSKAKSKGKRPARKPAVHQDGGDGDDVAEAGEGAMLKTPAREPILDLVGPSRTFETPRRPHHTPAPPPSPRGEHAVFDGPPPAFRTPSPTPDEARQRRRSGVHPRIPLSLPPSSPIDGGSTPATPNTHQPAHGGSLSAAFSTGRPLSVFRTELSFDAGSFQTPTRKQRGRPRDEEEDDIPVAEDSAGGTPLWKRPSSAGDNEALFAEGVVDEKDERASSQSIGWEDAGSDKENALASAPPPRNEGNPFDLIDSINRGILQPLSRTSSPDGGDDPFGLLAAERRIKERRLQAAREAVDELPTAGPSRLPAADDRRPFGPRTFADLDEPSPAPLSQQLPFPSSPAHPALGSRLPPSSPEIPRYSDSDVEDLYATPPAAPLPLTPRKRQQAETPRHSDNAREDVTMRKRRRRGADMSIEDFAERGSSAVSSPSPVKRTSTWDMGREEWENRPTKRLRAPGGGKENATAAAVVESSRMAAQADDATPRKRPRRSARERPGPAPDAESESDGHEHGKGKAKAPRGRSVTRGRGRGRGRGKGKGRSADASASRTRKKKDESTPDDIREKRERERQERVEYFKKLDGYTLPKENVYVI